MRVFYFIFYVFFVASKIHAQECELLYDDTVTLSEVLPYNLHKEYDIYIDAKDLLSKQSIDFLCWLVYQNGEKGQITLFSFKYKMYRGNMLLFEGTNEGDSYLRTKLGELIYDSKIGDSLIIYNYKTHIDHLKNVRLLPLTYKITKNSIHKSDKNELKGYEFIEKVAPLKKLYALYPGCGGSITYMQIATPQYNQNKTVIFYKYRFLTKDYENNKPIVDLDFSFVYRIKIGKMVVLDHLTGKEHTLVEWTKVINRFLLK